MSDFDLPPGTIVAFQNGQPWLLRQDGWYMGDVKQPNAESTQFADAPILRLGWTGRLEYAGG